MSVSADRLESVFIAASELPEAERSAYLDKACGSDPELRGAVEKMLAAHADPARIFDRLRPSLPPTGFHTALPDTGTILAGRYKLLEQIGEGGMGAVWMARQTEPIKRTVAVKLIKPGMDSKQVLARFEAERQALALMDHANIARVFDAGVTSDGRPFFVMELVKGEPITQFCDSRRLTLKERLELFVPVCLAIQHAHQ
jgi:eukaryotic-like serine/threonine-protein kinase